MRRYIVVVSIILCIVLLCTGCMTEEEKTQYYKEDIIRERITHNPIEKLTIEELDYAIGFCTRSAIGRKTQYEDGYWWILVDVYKEEKERRFLGEEVINGE